MNEPDGLEKQEGIAVIGLSGRFPGARGVEEFWRNLSEGRESISHFSVEEVLSELIPHEVVRQPNYVRARAILDDPDLFDASFFGMQPREAAVTDPQQRILLECAWEALEEAGYDPKAYEDPVGVFVGVGFNHYLLNNLYSNPDVVKSVGSFQTVIGNDRDHCATLLSYKLDLRGPSFTVQTACSTSLVAVHLACQSLLNGECSMALAGGATVILPSKSGYLYQQGGIMSPDGHCRPFDARAAGTVGGSGAALLLLKPLSLAIKDGDHVRAVIKGSAVNNDGSLKVGYTAPSIDGQAAVIAEALAVAGLSPSDISYVEAHGTATPLGDPVEVAALNRAHGGASAPCLLGSVKSNVGHLDAAAGVAGLIKTVLALEHEMLPPTLHYERPNPEIDFERGPFFVNAELRPWERADSRPRRAGVSSFGIGGTNAHVVLEEAPAREQGTDTAGGGPEVLLLSARTEAALSEARRRLADRLDAPDAPALGDAAFTLQAGRRAFARRLAVVCRDRRQAVALLRSNDPRAVLESVHETANRPVAFMFPGVGDHYVGMAAGLYETEPAFRKEVDRCSEILKPRLGCDLRDVIFAGGPQAGNGASPPASPLNLREMLGRGRPHRDARAERLNETVVAQPAVFVVEYALARLLMEWGVRPQAMIGYSIGEYVAACLAGVFSLEDALTLVAGRARLIQALPGGAMLAVSLSEEEVRPDLNERLWLAAVNGPALCVVGGEPDAVEAYRQRLLGAEVACRLLPTTHAFHSGMMDPIVADVTELAGGIRLYAPQLNYISNVTGTWIDAADPADPAYWARHMRQPVRFADGLRELWREPGRIMLEVGPGQSLTSLALQQRPEDAAREGAALPTMRTPYEQQTDGEFLLGTAARLWLAGYPLDWVRTHGDRPRRRVPLPTYSFDRQFYWLPPAPGESPTVTSAALTKKADVADWFYIPSWKRERPLASLDRAACRAQKHSWLIFLDGGGTGARVAQLLAGCGHEVVTVAAGEGFARVSARSFQIDPSRPEDYESLVAAQRESGRGAGRVVHLWGLSPRREGARGRDSFEEAQEVGFYSLLHLARALGRSGGEPLQIAVVTDRVQEVTGDEALAPEMATVLGPCKVIPQEYPDVTCRSIDVDLPGADPARAEQLARDLVNELLADDFAEAVAHRGGYRWAQDFEPLRLRPEPPAARLREGGAYVLFGGLGRIGLTLAEYLWTNARARLVLTGREGLPPREEWDGWLQRRGESETSYRIRKVRALEDAGAEVLVQAADVTDPAQMREALRRTRERFGDPSGVVYLAGLLGAASFCPIQETTRKASAVHFAPKAHGLYVLEEVLEGLELDFCVLFSSLASVLGGLGFAAYAAANVFVDAFVRGHNRRSPQRWLSEDWDTWLVREDEPRSMDFTSTRSELNMTPEQGQAAFAALLAAGDLTQAVVSVGDLQARLDRWIRREPGGAAEPAAPAASLLTSHPRPGLNNAFVAPRSETEQAIADIWHEVLGIEPVGVYDNFFQLGGHSLLGTQVISRIRKRFQEDISVRTFFTSPTVADLAEAVVQKRLERVDSATLAQLITDVRQATD